MTEFFLTQESQGYYSTPFLISKIQSSKTSFCPFSKALEKNPFLRFHGCCDSESELRLLAQQFDLVTSCLSVDSLNAYAVTTFGYIFKTTNGGVNWSNSILPNQPSNIPRQCSFANRDTGYIVTSFGNILKTTDGSKSWQIDSTFNPPYQQINVLYDVMALDINNAFVCGAGGRVIKTTNAGTNWITSTGGNYNFTSIYFTSENTGYTVGAEVTGIVVGDGPDVRTTNGGLNLVRHPVPM